MTKEEKQERKFIKLTRYWMDRLRINNVSFHKDNRIKYSAFVRHIRKGKKVIHRIIFYNIKNINSRHLEDLYHLIFHELGHIKMNTQFMKDERAEYLAEKFALKMLKKHYSRYYKKQIKWVKDNLDKLWWKKTFPIHYKAFIKIKEYKECLKKIS